MFNFHIYQLETNRRFSKPEDTYNPVVLQEILVGSYRRTLTYSQHIRVGTNFTIEKIWKILTHFDRIEEHYMVKDLFEKLLSENMHYERLMKEMDLIRDFSEL